MLKKVPIMPVFFFFSTKCPFLTITNTYSTYTLNNFLVISQHHRARTILRFHAKSEGLGDFSLLNNEMTQTLTSWPGSWESSGSLPELSTAAGPLLLLVLSLDSMLLLGTVVNDSI